MTTPPPASPSQGERDELAIERATAKSFEVQPPRPGAGITWN